MNRRRAILLAVLAGMAVPAAVTVARAASVAPDAADNRVGFSFNDGKETIFYQVRGSGPAIVLIHGFPLSGALFKHQLQALSASYRVVTLDLPGFGRSGIGMNTETDASYAAVVTALMDHLGIGSAIVGGHSMGGQVALYIATNAPGRVTGLVLFDTNPAPANLVEQAEWPGFGMMAQQMGSASIAPLIVPVMVTGDKLARDPSLGTKITQIVSEGAPAGVVAGAHALADRPDYRPMLGGIKVPTLVMEGRDDTVYPNPVAHALQAAIPGATLAVIPGAGHASMFQSPALANAAILAWAQASGLSK